MAEVDAVASASSLLMASTKGPGLQSLPNDILLLVIEQFVEKERLRKCLKLRLVSRYFNLEVLHLLFDLFYIEWVLAARNYKSDVQRLNCYLVHRYWHAFIQAVDPFRHLRRYRSSHSYRNCRSLGYGEEQLKWLSVLHGVLRQAVQNAARRQEADGQVERPNGDFEADEAGVGLPSACITMICEGAFCAAGREMSWKLLHPFSLNRTSTHLDTGLHLSAVEGLDPNETCPSFWEALAAVYSGDLKWLVSLFNTIKLKHQWPEDWINRVQTKYRIFLLNCSTEEHRWLELLAACIKIAVIKDNAEATLFLLDQDPVTESRVFRSICSSLFRLALSRRAIDVLALFIERGWHNESSNHVSISDFEHNQAIELIMGLPNTCLKRNKTLKQLLTPNVCWQTVAILELILDSAAVSNDISLVEIVASSLKGKLQGSTRNGIRRNAMIKHNPLATAVFLGHYEVTRYMLKHARKLHLSSMMSEEYPDCDFRTQPIKFLLSPQNAHNAWFLPELLKSAAHHRIEQIRVIASDENNIAMFKLFFEHVNATGKISHTDAKTFGEHALCAAIAYAQTPCATYLIEDLGVRFRSTRVLPSTEDVGRLPSCKNIATLPSGSKPVTDMETLLSKHGMELNRGKTVVRLVGSQCRH